MCFLAVILIHRQYCCCCHIYYPVWLSCDQYAYLIPTLTLNESDIQPLQFATGWEKVSFSNCRDESGWRVARGVHAVELATQFL